MRKYKGPTEMTNTLTQIKNTFEFYPARLSFKFNREIKSFTDKPKLRGFNNTWQALQQMLKALLKAEKKRLLVETKKNQEWKSSPAKANIQKGRKLSACKYIKTGNCEKRRAQIEDIGYALKSKRPATWNNTVHIWTAKSKRHGNCKLKIYNWYMQQTENEIWTQHVS